MGAVKKITGADERRVEPDHKDRERRVIPRVNDPELKSSLNHLQLLCKSWIGFSVICALTLVSSNLFGHESNWSRTAFYCMVVAVLAIGADRLRRSLNYYAKSRSLSKLALVVERAMTFIFLFTVIGFILGGTYVLSLL